MKLGMVGDSIYDYEVEATRSVGEGGRKGCNIVRLTHSVGCIEEGMENADVKVLLDGIWHQPSIHLAGMTRCPESFPTIHSYNCLMIDNTGMTLAWPSTLDTGTSCLY